MNSKDACRGVEEKAEVNKRSLWRACQPIKRWSSPTIVVFFFVLLLTTAFFCWIDLSTVSASFLGKAFTSNGSGKQKPIKKEFSLNCSNREGIAQICMANYTGSIKASNLSTATCPEYFRWIHEDLRPWKSTGISRDMLDRVKDLAHFRLVIVKGKAYLEKYRDAFQTRDLFTIWGILQLLRAYPGKVPDVELMFNCDDGPRILKNDYQGPNATSPLSLFQYCGRDDAFGVVFPDWSFWGWAEVNVRPWTSLLEVLKESNKRTKWQARMSSAHWKGNPHVSLSRAELMECKGKYARLYAQDWGRAIRRGFKDSKLEDQCTHRYKIYIEGRGWSVSEKYILACDSMTLLVKPDHFDFFDRSMVPLQHYWPIRATNKCRDIEFAVEWGNEHTGEAQAIGQAGSKFIQENLTMEYVYDYMFHSFSEYAKLLKFKPAIPEGAVELCSETMVCSQQGVSKKFMLESMVKLPSDALPCSMPPPYESQALEDFLERKKRISSQAEMWENEHWKKRNKSQPTVP